MGAPEGIGNGPDRGAAKGLAPSVPATPMARSTSA